MHVLVEREEQEIFWEEEEQNDSSGQGVIKGREVG